MDNNALERSILKTLIYHQIFNYSLNLSELIRYLVEFPQLDPSLVQNQVLSIPQIISNNNLYFLKGNSLQKELYQHRSWKLINKTIKFTKILQTFPFVKLIAVSGSVAALNASELNDIDLFIIVTKSRFNLWRKLVLLYFESINERVNLNKNPEQNSGKFCLNYFLDDKLDAFTQKEQDLYTAMEIAHLKVIYNKDHTFQKFLKMNPWIKTFLPNFWQMSISDWNFMGNDIDYVPQQTIVSNRWINDVRSKILDQYDCELSKYNLKNNE